MVRSPRATLTSVIAQPRSLDLLCLVVGIAAACSAGFLLTRVGQLAALDQQVRQLESFGAIVDDDLYGTLRQLVPYRPLISAAVILAGWPLAWSAIAFVLWLAGKRVADAPASFPQVFTIVVHAGSIFAVRALVAAPVNYVRESLGGATSLGMVMPSFGESTFPARLLGAVDIFVLWWVVLVAMGLSILYRTRTLPIARWLVGAYTAAALALALVQVLRGGM
jgi:hypothetical protein